MKTVKATIPQVESLIDELISESEYLFTAEKRENESTETFSFIGFVLNNVECGHIALWERDGWTGFLTKINRDVMHKAYGNGTMYEEMVDDYKEWIYKLRSAILKRFEKAKPEEPAEIVDPLVAARREKVKELSLKKKTIEAIANEVDAKRSTVIRDRDILGITKKRKKKR